MAVLLKALAGEFVDEGRARTGEVAGTLSGSRNDGLLRLALPVALPFVVGEEEVSVAPDGPAHSRAELILVERFG